MRSSQSPNKNFFRLWKKETSKSIKRAESWQQPPLWRTVCAGERKVKKIHGLVTTDRATRKNSGEFSSQVAAQCPLWMGDVSRINNVIIQMGTSSSWTITSSVYGNVIIKPNNCTKRWILSSSQMITSMLSSSQVITSIFSFSQMITSKLSSSQVITSCFHPAR